MSLSCTCRQLARPTLLRIVLWALPLVLLAPGGHFMSARAQTDDGRIGVLVAAGDIAACWRKDRKYKDVADLIGAAVSDADGKIRVLALGDLAYANRNEDDEIIDPKYPECFDEFVNTWGKYKQYILPVPGNHDYADDPAGGGTYKNYFSEIYTKLAKKDEYFYATQFPEGDPAGWLLVSFNFEEDRERQHKWLAETLANSKARCILVFAHPFVNSSGHWGRKYRGMTYAKMKVVFDIMHTHAATVLITAHDHDLEQFARQDTGGEVSTEGVRSFVVGTGGARLYTVPDDKRHKRSEKFANESRGILKLVLYKDRYSWSFSSVPKEPTVKLPGGSLPDGSEECNPGRAK